MRAFAKLGAFAALASLSAAQTRPFAHVETTCSAQATETVFVTVFPPESSVVSAVSSSISTEAPVLSTVTILPASGPAGIPVTTYDQSVPSITKTSSVGPAVSTAAPAPVLSEASSIVTIETFTVAEGPSGLPFTGTLTITRLCPGAVDCTGGLSAEPTDFSTVVPAPVEAASTFILTTTITSGISPQVVETSTYTVIETLSSDVTPVASSTAISLPTSASIPEMSRSLSTASFTLTLETVTVPNTILSSSPTSSSSSVLITPYASATLSTPTIPASVSLSLTILTVTLPGVPGATPTVLTITATEAVSGAPLTPVPTPVSVVTMTTTVVSGGTEVSLSSPSATVSDVVMTYTVFGPDGLALTTMTMATLYTYTPLAGVGTSYVPVSTVTAVNTVTVETTLPLPPFPNITTPFVTTITPFPSTPGYTFTPPPENITTSIPAGNATGAPIESPPAITPSVTTIFINGTPVATSVIVPINSTTLVAPVPGSPTEVPPAPTGLPSSPTELPPSPTEVPTSPTELPPSPTEVPPVPTTNVTTVFPPVPTTNVTTVFPPVPTTNGTTVFPPVPTTNVTTVFPPVPTTNGTTVFPPVPTTNGTTVLPPVTTTNGTTVLPPIPTTNVTTVFPPVPTTNGTTVLPPPSGSSTETPPAPTNTTISASASVIIPLKSTTLVIPLPTNVTSPGNVTASLTQGQGGASPTSTVNGTAPSSPPANQTTSGNGTLPITSHMTSGLSSILTSSVALSLTSNTGFSVPTDSTIFTVLPTGGPSLTDFIFPVGSTPSVNVTTSIPSANQTATSGQSAPTQGGHGGQGAPSGSPSANVTTPAPTANGTASAGPTESGPGQSAPSQGGQGGPSKSQGAPSQGAPSQGAPSQGGQGGQGAPTQGGQSKSQGAPTQGGQGQSQSAPAQTSPPQSQGSQGQSQGSQSRSQGGQSQGGQGQSQGGQGQSQGGQGQSQGGQSRSQGQGQSVGAGQPQGNADPLNTALGLPSPTGVPGASLSTLTTIITLVSRSAPGVKARAATAVPTATAACEKAADKNEVVFDFDDLPTLQVQMAPGSMADDMSPIPMYSPYHRFAWSEGFRVFPSSVCPYESSSGDLMIEYSPSTKTHGVAEIGVGGLHAIPCFRFDFTSVRVGCASTGASCKFNVTGLAWDFDSQAMVTVASHTFSTRACSAQKDCRLESIAADTTTGLTNLTSVLIEVTAGGQPQTWWADDLTLSWTDSTCESAGCRSGVRDVVPKRGRRHGQTRVLDTFR